MRFRAALLAGIVVAAGQLLLAQQEPLPTFRTGVEAVQMDVVVTDADGNFVTDLTADDFEIVENGVPQTVTAFSLVDIPLNPPLGPVSGWPVRSDVISNDGPEGRVYMFAFDTTMAPHLALRTRLFVRRFLEEHFRPNDLAAVVFLGRGLVTDGHDFTSDPRALLAAADRFMGGDENPFGALDRLAMLRHLTELLGSMPGRRKAFLWFGSAPGFDAADVDRLRPSRLALRFGSDDRLDAISAATRGSVLFYPISPSGLTTEFESLDDRMDMVALGNVTGGFAVANSNSFAAGFDRIVRDHSTYYVLGFNSSYTARDGRFVGVDIRVRRPGLQVQARDGYVAAVGRPPAARAPIGTPSAAVDALEHPLATRGVPIHVFAAPYRSASGTEAAVALVVEVDVSTLEFVERDGGLAADLEVAYMATDARKRAYPGGRHRVSFVVPPDAAAWHSRARLVSQLALPPGRHQIRVGAGSGTRSGSVVYDLEVPDFTRDRLLLSGVSITSTDAGALQTFRPPAATSAERRSLRCNPPTCVVPLLAGAPSDEDPLRGVLAEPTTAREFDVEETVTLFAEVYENLPRAAAHTITFSTSVTAEDGTVFPMTSETRASGGERRPSGGYGFTAEIPLHDLEPGRYLLVVEASSDAGDGATVSRAVPIDVR